MAALMVVELTGQHTPPPSRSVVPTTEHFDPALFMSVVHATASFNDIRNGLQSLEGAKANQVRVLLEALLLHTWMSHLALESGTRVIVQSSELLILNSVLRVGLSGKRTAASRPGSLRQLRPLCGQH